MSLESTVKFHYAKTQQYTDSPHSTDKETLTGTDYIGAMGIAMSKSPMGYCAFMGKVGISDNDAARAVSLLTDYAFQTCDRVAALCKLPADIKPAVMQTLATYAYMDYCRSAASLKPCECCIGKGFIEADVFSMKAPLSGGYVRRVEEVAKIRCKQCSGKGVVSTACRDCNGRGRAVMKEETERQGVPVMGDCKRCRGRGFERIPSTDSHNAICEITNAISVDTWKKSCKPFYDQLITKLEIEESWANASLNRVTA